MPATGATVGTPQSISARLPPHTDAIDDEPLDSRISETTRTVYGKSSYCGMIRATEARKAAAAHEQADKQAAEAIGRVLNEATEAAQAKFDGGNK